MPVLSRALTQNPAGKPSVRSVIGCAGLAGLFGNMADGLDVVTIRVKHEGAVVVWMVVGTQARRAVIAASRGKCSRMERIDQLAA